MDLSGSMQGAGGVGGLLLLTDHSTLITHFPTYDGNGNISEYLTATGTIAAHFEYDPFGNTVVNTDSSNLFNYRFSTKPRDSETGLYYYGYRYYDPATGRWPSRDPIEEIGGINIYEFVWNDSLNIIDLLGLDGTSEFFKNSGNNLIVLGGGAKVIDKKIPSPPLGPVGTVLVAQGTLLKGTGELMDAMNKIQDSLRPENRNPISEGGGQITIQNGGDGGGGGSSGGSSKPPVPPKPPQPSKLLPPPLPKIPPVPPPNPFDPCDKPYVGDVTNNSGNLA